MAKIPTDGNLVSPMGDLATAVAIGAIGGWVSFRLFAMNDDVNGGGTTEDIWPMGTVKVWPTLADQAVVVSDNAADTSAGTGAQTVFVGGLDEDYNEVSEIVTMNGLANVNTINSYLRINRIYCLRVGTAGVNVGNISISIGGDVQKYVEAGEGNCHCGFWTVPAGKTILINTYSAGVGRMGGSSDAQIEGQIRLYDEDSNDNYQSWRTISDIYLYNGGRHYNDGSVVSLPERTDIRGQITSTSATQCDFVFGGFVIDNATQGNF